MNCGSCGRVIYAKQSHCACGWKIPPGPRPPGRLTPPSDPSGIVGRRFGEKMTEVREHNEAFLQKNPGATQREACLAFLAERRLVGSLPEPVRSAIDPEAAAEREAIQAESQAA